MANYYEVQINAMIEANDNEGLLSIAFAEGNACCCVGPRDGNPVCYCLMPYHTLDSMIDIEELIKGKIVRKLNE